jgi:hypothetical protein
MLYVRKLMLNKIPKATPSIVRAIALNPQSHLLFEIPDFVGCGDPKLTYIRRVQLGATTKVVVWLLPDNVSKYTQRDKWVPIDLENRCLKWH